MMDFAAVDLSVRSCRIQPIALLQKVLQRCLLRFKEFFAWPGSGLHSTTRRAAATGDAQCDQVLTTSYVTRDSRQLRPFNIPFVGGKESNPRDYKSFKSFKSSKEK